MKIIRSIVVGLAAVGFIAWLGYVFCQWPSEVQELSIPPGRVVKLPGTEIKGICVQGNPGGFFVWYRVTPYNSNEVAEMRALMEHARNVKWGE